MADKLELQKEALSQLVDYSEHIMKATRDVIKEFRGDKKRIRTRCLISLSRG